MIHGWYGSTPEEYKEYLNEVLSIGPDLIIDDSGDMVETQHK
jgi:adenosylhomocysteinase